MHFSPLEKRSVFHLGKRVYKTLRNSGPMQILYWYCILIQNDITCKMITYSMYNGFIPLYIEMSKTWNSIFLQCTVKTCKKIGKAVQSRAVYCTNGNGTVMHQSECQNVPVPTGSRECDNTKCQVEWYTSKWTKVKLWVMIALGKKLYLIRLYRVLRHVGNISAI